MFRAVGRATPRSGRIAIRLTLMPSTLSLDGTASAESPACTTAGWSAPDLVPGLHPVRGERTQQDGIGGRVRPEIPVDRKILSGPDDGPTDPGSSSSPPQQHPELGAGRRAPA